jgi:hypothetical protein
MKVTIRKKLFKVGDATVKMKQVKTRNSSLQQIEGSSCGE